MDENPNSTGLYFWTGAEFKDLPPVLKQKFIDARENKTRKYSLVAITKKTLVVMKPGEVKGFGPLQNEADAVKALKSIRNAAAKMHWPEGASCGTLEDDETHLWYVTVMRKDKEELI